MRIYDAQSILLIIDYLKKLRSRNFEILSFAIRYENSINNTVEYYKNFSDFEKTIMSQVNTKKAECQIGEFSRLQSVKVRNKNLDKYSNTFRATNIYDNLNISSEKSYDRFRNSKIKTGVNRYEKLLDDILSEYKDKLDKTKKTDLTKLYVLPCYVEDGYVTA